MNQRFWTRVGCSLILIGAVVWSSSFLSANREVASAWASKQKRAPAGQMVEVPLGQGQPWHGGKPSLAVTLESDVSGEITSDQWVSVRFSMTPGVGCQQLASRIRGVDGLEVQSQEQVQACQEGVPTFHEAQVRVAAGKEGMAAVDIEVLTEDGLRRVTRAVPFRSSAPGASSSEDEGIPIEAPRER